MNDIVTSWIRTIVPLAAAWAATRADRIGISIDPSDVEGLAVPLLGAGWYTAARLLERWHPAFGWLLGSTRQPSYDG